MGGASAVLGRRGGASSGERPERRSLRRLWALKGSRSEGGASPGSGDFPAVAAPGRGLEGCGPGGAVGRGVVQRRGAGGAVGRFGGEHGQAMAPPL